MKVLFVSSGNAQNGISPIVKNQGISLSKAGLDINYFLINGKGFFSYLKHIFILRKYLKSHKFDVIHAHYSLSAITAALAGCKPLVVSLMGSDTKSGIIQKYVIRLFSFLIWRGVIVKSESMKRNIRIRAAQIIPNGIDLYKVKPQSSIINNNGLAIILFASDPLRYAKNFPLAEKAISLMNSRSVKLKVVYSLDHEEIIRELNSASLLLLTSRWEGSPNIVKEAMACNCPVVATDVGDVRWLFGNEPGHYLTTFEPEDVAEKIQKAMEFSEKHKRTNGRERITQLGLDSETVAKKIINVYEKVLERTLS